MAGSYFLKGDIMGEIGKSIQDLLDEIRKNGEICKKDEGEQKTDENQFVCKYCEDKGYYKAIDSLGLPHLKDCPYCFEKRKMALILKKSGISAGDYAKYTLDTFDAQRSKNAAKMKNMAVKYLDEHPSGIGFGVFGQSGGGKTHICIALCQAITEKYHEEHYYFPYNSQMIKLMKAAQSYHDDYEDIMRGWKSCDNLYIDDLLKMAARKTIRGKNTYDPNELYILFDLINARYLNHKTTFFSSEYSVKDIINIDEALGSRIFEMINPYGCFIAGNNERINTIRKIS